MTKSYLIIFSLLISSSFFYSCKKEEDCCVTQDTTIEITFKDASGNDLLNPATTGAFNTENVDLFYLNNGQKERVYNGNMDSPENFFVFETNGNYYMRLFPSEYVVGNESTTFIEFNKTDTDTDTDTLTCQLIKTKSKVICTKVWYNSELVWNGEGPRHLEIKK